ncbi:hypothetical protein L3X38_016978 [Prunus dulcis]|uniref:Uncharacterized protein n=1 Tax=Prunus dulcis TaxID=3755 RepID=A0AAD4W879_PRUDU|nr:hypothetical protein L3X38_016978 [Prunus dulcis]
MNPPTSLTTDSLILGLARGASPTSPQSTLQTETPARQHTLEARMEALQQEMTKIQEHNILSSKLDDTRRELYDHQSHSAQLREDLERTTTPWQQQLYKSVPKPNGRGREKERAATKPSPPDDCSCPPLTIGTNSTESTSTAETGSTIDAKGANHL